MINPPSGDITILLDAVRRGESGASERLVERIYGELRAVAARLMANEAVNHTLQPTALLNEAFTRLLPAEALGDMPNRAYLFGAAATANASRSTRLAWYEANDLHVVDVHDALERLATLNERQSRVVTLRVFGGLTIPEIAQHLGVSLSTVESDFRLARAWLRRQLDAGDGDRSS